MAAAPAVAPAARRALNANLGTITNLPSRDSDRKDAPGQKNETSIRFSAIFISSGTWQTIAGGFVFGAWWLGPTE